MKMANVTWASMVDLTECENDYLIEAFSHLQLDDEFHFIVARVNNQNEIMQFEKTIVSDKKNILIMKSDEAGIIPPFLDRLFLVFRMYNNNSLVDYKKIFPIPCGFSRCFNQNGKLYYHQPEKVKKPPLIERIYDLFYSGQRSPKRAPMIAAVNCLKGNYNTLINETNHFADGYDLNQYYNYLSNTKIALVPEGAVIPESFRYFEAFERNCVVITTFPKNSFFNNWYYETSPAIFLNDWSELNDSLIDKILDDLGHYQIANEDYFNGYISPFALATYIQNTIANL